MFYKERLSKTEIDLYIIPCYNNSKVSYRLTYITLLLLPPVAARWRSFLFVNRKKQRHKTPTDKRKHGKAYQNTNRQTERNHRATQDAPGGRDRVSEIKKVLPRVGGHCTVGYPAPPAYFIKFENGVSFIHKNRYNTHG